MNRVYRDRLHSHVSKIRGGLRRPIAATHERFKPPLDVDIEGVKVAPAAVRSCSRYRV